MACVGSVSNWAQGRKIRRNLNVVKIAMAEAYYFVM